MMTAIAGGVLSLVFLVPPLERIQAQLKITKHGGKNEERFFHVGSGSERQLPLSMQPF